MAATLFHHARVYDGVSPAPVGDAFAARDGRLVWVGWSAQAPALPGATLRDLGGATVVPGFVDAHTHLGVDEEGEGWAGADFNEMTDPLTAGVRAIDAINPCERGFDDALAGGVTCVNITPGSANPIGGEMVAVKTHGAVVDEMVVRSPSGLKAALGENPKRVYGEQKKSPSTRLGTAYLVRQAFAAAAHHAAKSDAEPDLGLDNLARVLARELPLRQHAHRADDVMTALRLADEFGYDLVLEHGTEAWKVADRVAARGVPVLFGPMLTTRSKVELRDRTAEGAGILERAGAKVAIITDHPVIPIDLLCWQAMLAVKEGMTREGALRAITLTPAEVLGVDGRLGSLDVGKDADLALWSGDPLDARERALRVWIDGRDVYHYDQDERRRVVAPRV